MATFALNISDINLVSTTTYKVHQEWKNCLSVCSACHFLANDCSLC